MAAHFLDVSGLVLDDQGFVAFLRYVWFRKLVLGEGVQNKLHSIALQPKSRSR